MQNDKVAYAAASVPAGIYEQNYFIFAVSGKVCALYKEVAANVKFRLRYRFGGYLNFFAGKLYYDALSGYICFVKFAVAVKVAGTLCGKAACAPGRLGEVIQVPYRAGALKVFHGHSFAKAIRCVRVYAERFVELRGDILFRRALAGGGEAA